MDKKILVTTLLGVAAGFAGAFLWQRFMKKPCGCAEKQTTAATGQTAVSQAVMADKPAPSAMAADGWGWPR